MSVRNVSSSIYLDIIFAQNGSLMSINSDDTDHLFSACTTTSIGNGKSSPLMKLNYHLYPLEHSEFIASIKNGTISGMIGKEVTLLNCFGLRIGL